MYIYPCTYVCVCVYVYIYMFHVYVSTYIYIYAYIYIYIYIYVYVDPTMSHSICIFLSIKSNMVWIWHLWSPRDLDPQVASRVIRHDDWMKPWGSMTWEICTSRSEHGTYWYININVNMGYICIYICIYIYIETWNILIFFFTFTDGILKMTPFFFPGSFCSSFLSPKSGSSVWLHCPRTVWLLVWWPWFEAKRSKKLQALGRKL